MEEKFLVMKIRPKYQNEDVHDGNWLLVEPSGLADAVSDSPVDEKWEMTIEWMSRREIDALPEFEGF